MARGTGVSPQQVDRLHIAIVERPKEEHGDRNGKLLRCHDGDESALRVVKVSLVWLKLTSIGKPKSLLSFYKV